MSQLAVDAENDDLAELSDAEREALKPLLYPGEQALWVGRPVSRAAWGDMMPSATNSRWSRVLMYTITAGMALYLLFWMLLVMVVGIGSDIQKGHFSVWGFLLTSPILIFLLIFGWTMVLIIANPWLSMRMARNRVYVLTNRQAVTLYETSEGVTLERVDLADVVQEPTVHRLRKDGVGDIIYGGFSVTQMSGDGGMDMHADFDTGFNACPDAQRVRDLFTEARRHRMTNREREDIDEMQRDYQGWLRRNGRL